MDALFMIFALLAAFAVLSLMTSERQRVLNDREAARVEQAPPPAPADDVKVVS